MFNPYGSLVPEGRNYVDSSRSQVEAAKSFQHTCAKYCIVLELFPTVMILQWSYNRKPLTIKQSICKIDYVDMICGG